MVSKKEPSLFHLVHEERVCFNAIHACELVLLSYEPYGKQGSLIAGIDITATTGLLAARCRSV